MATEKRFYEPPPQLLRRRTGQAILSLLSLILGVFAGVAAVRFLSSPAFKPAGPHGFGTFEHGFATEQILPNDLYQIEQRRFSGDVDWLPSGEEVMNLPPSEPAYVGDPTPAIDKAWDELVGHRYWSIAESEAKSLWGVNHVQYRDYVKGGYTGGFDVFHMLHCLDMMRQRLSPEYYLHMHAYSGMEHDMHCIEQIRQRLQCSADSTITPAKYFEHKPGWGMYVDSAQVHTCRNFQNLWKYTQERSNGSLKVPRIQWQ
ncbi:unnamed protein product [Zymoseptoria tritici ST99CH_3D1]|uniref:Uncharacterized protein n=1 Tax=Zymoseptoria tritici (strain ST99CH_3D7) TaxID=1276538 RepID=A0A1X7RTZ9_ZYMT9|nr:unnamed protein product [Zymoseptoria tritici ST99CH_3D7]SMR53753.1 unnamed protein product [Zymoseptoria tritici ST99CH_3D1]